jgi:hypothetical protein
MKSNRTLISATLARVAVPALLLCLLCLGISARGFAEEKPQPTTSPWAIQVEPVQADEGQLPPEFSMATYENLITQLVKTDKFQQVFRSGDHQADGVPNLLVLRTTLLNFERGSQTKRAVTTVGGATKVKVHLKVTTRDGNAVVEKDVQGTVRIFGENLKATYDLAKDIAKTLSEASLPAPAKGAGQ